ncbi:hypothetical protein N5C36_20150 [Shewanella xiamenensis]|uniref:hypothetical protein n=1 Tax=Shewanella xiamenensis TaxID=332186 RepID=UPI00244B28B3|nr:hypothetical protein [Shewanella xiamenensis]MDH1316387.1 hypothetical protein [Shewanella xiamenensis]
MARRKQLKGVAGNIVQWCLSRNFDYQGYWAVGLLYAYAQENGTNECVINLVNEHAPNEVTGVKFSEAIKLLSCILQRDLESLKIPDWWVKDAKVIFTFNTDDKKKYHLWASGLGGKPAMCLVEITTDLGKTYTKEGGCNVWVHNPEKESRRYGF